MITISGFHFILYPFPIFYVLWLIKVNFMDLCHGTLLTLLSENVIYGRPLSIIEMKLYPEFKKCHWSKIWNKIWAKSALSLVWKICNFRDFQKDVYVQQHQQPHQHQRQQHCRPDLHTMHRRKIVSVLFGDKRWLDYQSQELTWTNIKACDEIVGIFCCRAMSRFNLWILLKFLTYPYYDPYNNVR